MTQAETTLRDEASAARARLALLSEVSRALSASMSAHRRIEELIECLTPDFCDACAVEFADEGGLASGRHAQALRRVLETGKPVNEPAAGFAYWLGLPLLMEGAVVGAMAFAREGARRRFDAEDERLAEEICSRAAGAVHNARLFEQLQESRRQLQAITDAAPAAILQLDAEGRYVFANRNYLARWGVRRLEDIVGRTMREVVGEEAFAKVAEPFSKALSGAAVTFEGFLPGKDTGPRVLQASFAPQIADGGRVNGVIGVALDVTELREAEAALRDNDKLFRLALEAAELGFWDWDVASDRCRWSLPRLRAWGEPPQGRDARFEELLPYIHEADRDPLRQSVLRALVYGGAFEAEFRVRLPERGLFWLEARGHVFFNTAGRAARMIGVVRDATSRRRAEEERERLLAALESEHEALRASEERYRGLFENNPHPLIVYDVQTLAILAVNQAASEHYGYSGEEFLQLNLRDLKPAEDLPTARLPSPDDQTPRRRHEARHRKKDGTIIDVDIVSHAFRFEGKPARLVLVHDITERKAAERRAAAEQRERQMIFDSVPAMIWYKDTHNRILRCNKAAASSIGRGVQSLEGKPLEEIYPDEAAAYYRDDLEVIRTGRPKLGIVERLMTAYGEKRWIQTDKIPYLDEQGRVAGVIVLSVDITERKRVEDVLRESERAQREFVANVSHEFRTPVAAIKGFAETLRLGGVKDVKNRARFVRIIERHSERLAALVENLLRLSAIESGMIKLEPTNAELKPLIEEYVESVGTLTRRKSLKVSTRVRAGVRAVVDEAMLLQVLENLVGNAVKFQREGGSVTISAALDGRQVRVSVVDDGPGISPKDLPRIFERFYKGQDAAGSFGSTGLGLHIVKKIVEAHGGRVWAESRPGRGASFHFTLPRAS